MDTPEYTTLAAALKGLPDPRQRRGQRYPWSLLILAALLSGERHGRGIGQWVQEHAAELGDRLGWPGPQLPSEATLRRALRELDLGTLEDCLLRIRPATESPKPGRWQGQALDGKALRGARAHDRPIHLLGLVSHQGRVLAQLAVAEHANEITAAPALLAGRTLQGTVTTLEAELTQWSLAAQIRAPGATHGGQGQSTDPASAEWQHVPVSGLASGAASVAAPGGADGGQGARPAGEAAELARSAPGAAPDLAEAVDSAVSSLPPEAMSAAELERLWRGHWVIENRVHYVRDVTLGEDGGQAYRGNTPQALAILRNGLLNVLRGRGWKRIADALRHYGAAVERARLLIGALPASL